MQEAEMEDRDSNSSKWYKKIFTLTRKQREHAKPRRSNSGSQSPEVDDQDVVKKAPTYLQRLISQVSTTRDSVAMYNLSRQEREANNFGVKGNWHTMHEIADLENEARLGDRLEFSRSNIAAYGHWGIYVGRAVNKDYDHQVIHFGIFRKGGQYSKKKLCGLGPFATRKPEILVSSIEEILGADWVRINNIRDTNWPPLEADDIIREAVQQLENQTYDPPVYHIFRNNCEHFVNFCRYGRHRSDQAEDYVRSVPLINRLIATK